MSEIDYGGFSMDYPKLSCAELCGHWQPGANGEAGKCLLNVPYDQAKGCLKWWVEVGSKPA